MSVSVILQQLAGGFGKTLLIFCLTLAFSLPLGLLVCLGRMSRWAPFRTRALPTGRLSRFRPIQLIFKLLISILRGTPLMLQLLAVCYGPYYLFHAKLTANWTFIALILGFVINYAAYFAEIYRGGIESMPVGQYEAAEVLGYTKVQTFGKIILPQVVKRILPAVTNEVITLVKDTSMAFVLAYAEMFTLAKQIAAAKTTFMPLFVAGVFYFVFNGIVAYAMEFLEKKLAYYR
ncbi:MAG: amino acid ABC transporter permease [Oscillospiraceae bacterium]|nr:amino acid ABC transporter permease [Oscillospiraceae bacterium]